MKEQRSARSFICCAQDTAGLGYGKHLPVSVKTGFLNQRRIEDKTNIFFLFLSENVCYDPSLEPSRLVETVLIMSHNIR